MAFQVGAGQGVRKILDVRHGDRQELIELEEMHGYTYAEVVNMIREQFGGSIFNDDTIILHLTRDPLPGSVISTDAQINIAINLPGHMTLIYVTAFFSMNVVRTRILGLTQRVQNIERTITDILFLFSGIHISNMYRRQHRRQAGHGQGWHPPAPPSLHQNKIEINVDLKEPAVRVLRTCLPHVRFQESKSPISI